MINHFLCFAGAISWWVFVAAIFMPHENGDNKGQTRGDKSKVSWLNKSIQGLRKIISSVTKFWYLLQGAGGSKLQIFTHACAIVVLFLLY